MQIDAEIDVWMGYSVSSIQKSEKRVIYMLAILQPILNFILTFSAVLGVVFMIVCTAFVIISLIRGDIKISMIKDATEKQDK